MTDNFLLTELNWDDEESLFDRSEPEGGKHHFGHLRLYVPQVTKHWEAGKYFTIPGVVGGDFNEKADDGNMMFKSFTKGGNDKLYILVATKQDQNGNDYQIVKQYPSRRYRKSDKLVSADILIPSLKAMPKEYLKQIMASGIYAEWDEVETGDVFKANGEEKPIMAWAHFKPFENKEAMVKAQNEFFSQFSGNSDVVEVKPYHPQSWTANDYQQMLDYAKTTAETVKDAKSLACQLMLIVDDKGEYVSEYGKGQPAVAVNGEPVPVAKVLSELLNKPEPMLGL